MKPARQASSVTVKNIFLTVSLVTVMTMAIYPLQAQAQDNSAVLTPTLQVNDPCKSVVSKFEQTIGFIRQSQGNKAAAELKE